MAGAAGEAKTARPDGLQFTGYSFDQTLHSELYSALGGVLSPRAEELTKAEAVLRRAAKHLQSTLHLLRIGLTGSEPPQMRMAAVMAANAGIRAGVLPDAAIVQECFDAIVASFADDATPAPLQNTLCLLFNTLNTASECALLVQIFKLATDMMSAGKTRLAAALADAVTEDEGVDFEPHMVRCASTQFGDASLTTCHPDPHPSHTPLSRPHSHFVSQAALDQFVGATAAQSAGKALTADLWRALAAVGRTRCAPELVASLGGLVACLPDPSAEEAFEAAACFVKVMTNELLNSEELVVPTLSAVLERLPGCDVDSQQLVAKDLLQFIIDAVESTVGGDGDDEDDEEDEDGEADEEEKQGKGRGKRRGKGKLAAAAAALEHDSEDDEDDEYEQDVAMRFKPLADIFGPALAGEDFPNALVALIANSDSLDEKEDEIETKVERSGDRDVLDIFLEHCDPESCKPPGAAADSVRGVAMKALKSMATTLVYVENGISRVLTMLQCLLDRGDEGTAEASALAAGAVFAAVEERIPSDGLDHQYEQGDPVRESPVALAVLRSSSSACTLLGERMLESYTMSQDNSTSAAISAAVLWAVAKHPGDMPCSIIPTFIMLVLGRQGLPPLVSLRGLHFVTRLLSKNLDEDIAAVCCNSISYISSMQSRQSVCEW